MGVPPFQEPRYGRLYRSPKKSPLIRSVTGVWPWDEPELLQIVGGILLKWDFHSHGGTPNGWFLLENTLDD